MVHLFPQANISKPGSGIRSKEQWYFFPSDKSTVGAELEGGSNLISSYLHAPGMEPTAYKSRQQCLLPRQHHAQSRASTFPAVTDLKKGASPLPLGYVHVEYQH